MIKNKKRVIYLILLSLMKNTTKCTRQRGNLRNINANLAQKEFTQKMKTPLIWKLLIMSKNVRREERTRSQRKKMLVS